MICPNCGFDSPPAMRYCGSCGKHLAMACTECGFINPLNFRYCGNCGTQLFEEIAQPFSGPEIPQPVEDLTAPVSGVSSTRESERRLVTVIVTDMTDSTPLLEELGTEKWVELMSAILHLQEAEVNRFGGEVGQFRGDGMVAYFGATSAHEDDPERAVLAAISMLRAFDVFKTDLAQAQAIDLQMRVGVNTGEVIVAGSSSRQYWEETAMGAAVTVAARMETAAQPGTVLVSENTYRLVEGLFTWQSLGEITIKGVSQPIAVFQPQPHIFNHLPDRQTLPESLPRIGREAEFNTLKDSITGLFTGRGHIVVLTGDKGSGKSLLVTEVRRYFSHLEALLPEAQATAVLPPAPLIWINGRCRSYSQTWPYMMWQDLFLNWLGIRLEASKEEKSLYLRRQAVELFGDSVDEHYPYLANFLGLPVEEPLTEKIRYLDGEGLRQRFFLAVRSWIEAASQRGSVVIAFSNLQWADDSSIALLKFCLPVCDNESLLWLLSFRLEHGTPVWDFHHFIWANFSHRITDVPLHPLNESQSSELINHLLGPDVLPAETCTIITQNAEGNPYYIIELIRALIANDVLIRDAETGQWKVTHKITTLDLPESLQLLLLARIDRLSAQQKLVLQIAAVIGPVFWFNLVQALLQDSGTIKAELAVLQRAQFIQEIGRVPELGMQYVFKTPLIRETAYESLLTPQRTAFHLNVAEFLENEINQDILEGYDGLLAYHYRYAGKPNKELFYTVLAAEYEQKIFANTEALQDYTRAMELVESLQKSTSLTEEDERFLTLRFEILQGRREILFRLGQFEAASADTRALLPLAREMAEDPVWLIDALLAQTDYLGDNREELLPGLQKAEEALALAQQIRDLPREMRCLIRIANYRFTLKDTTSMEFAERALELARQLDDLKAEVNLLLDIGHAYGIDNLKRSRGYLEAALERSERLNDKATEITLLNALGQHYERQGDYYRQLTEFEQKRLRLSREIGNRVEEGQALMFCGQIQGLYLGDYAGGLELENQTLEKWEPITARIFPLLRISQIQAAQGQIAEALSTLAVAEPLVGKVIHDIGRAGFDLVKAIVYIELGDEEYLNLALQLTSQIQQMVAEQLVSRQYQMSAACKAAVAHLKLAHLLAMKDINPDQWMVHHHQALEASQAALNIYQAFEFVQIVECTSEEIFFVHSQTLAATDQTDDAHKYLCKAYDELMRKYNLIPEESPFRRSYLENIKLHQDIINAYAAIKAS